MGVSAQTTSSRNLKLYECNIMLLLLLFVLLCYHNIITIIGNVIDLIIYYYVRSDRVVLHKTYVYTS